MSIKTILVLDGPKRKLITLFQKNESFEDLVCHFFEDLYLLKKERKVWHALHHFYNEIRDTEDLAYFHAELFQKHFVKFSKMHIFFFVQGQKVI